MKRVLGLGVLLAGLGSDADFTRADEASPAPIALRAGFVTLEQLGAPSAAGATYVELSSRAAQSLLPYPFELRGNAWLLDETRGTNGQPVKGTFIANGADVIEVFYDKDRWRESDDAEVSNRLFGSWHPANVTRDTRAVLKFLKEQGDEPSANVHLDSSVRASLFFFAMHLFQRGDTNNADRIVRGLFQRVQDRRVVIVEAMNRLADTQYERVYRDFLGTRDWRAYRSGVTNLMACYPRGWNARPGLGLLLQHIDQRLAATPPLPVSTNGLTEADLALAASMLNLRRVHATPTYSSASVPWLLPSAWRAAQPPEGDLDLEIRARGLACLPFLIALAEDDALTDVDAKVLRGPYYTPPFLNSDAEDKARAVFDRLERPATRGEVALRILGDILPESLNPESFSRPKTDELLAAARAFHTEFARRSEENLAARLLSENDQDLDAPILTLLFRTAAGRRVPALEAYLVSDFAVDHGRYSFMTEPDAIAERRASILTRYAAVRGVEVSLLVTQLVARIETAAENYRKSENVSYGSAEQNDAHEAEMARKVREQASRLKSMDWSVTTDRLIEEALQRDADNAVLSDRLAVMPAGQVVGLVLDKAVAAPTPDARLRASRLIEGVLCRRGADAPAIGATNQANQWRVLVADERAGTNSETSVADSFLCLNEALFASTNVLPRETTGAAPWPRNALHEYRWGRPSPGLLASRVLETYGAAGRELVRARVLGRLAGTPEDRLTTYPHQTPPSTAELESIRARFAAVTTREAAARLVDGQPLSVLAALPDILNADSPLNARLATLASTVTSVTVSNDAALQGALAAWLNRPVDPALIRALCDYCLRQSSNQVPVDCRVERRAGFRGCAVTVYPPSATSMESGRGDEDEAGSTNARPGIVGVTGLVYTRGLLGSAHWRTAPLPEKVNWGTFVTSEPDDLRLLEQTWADFCGDKVEATSAGIVRFVSKGAAR